ncbi:MAG TPA: serine--tRNA ligase [Gemmatimonadaceae bacterium]|nr:serine--tRNA ligase [Gemmatimonadaceae bacterium]
MHDVKLIREQIEPLRLAMRRRGKLEALAPQLDRLEALDVERRRLIGEVEQRKAARNTASQEVARRKKAKEPADELIVQTRLLGQEIAGLETELRQAEDELERHVLEIPNVVAADVPEGGEEDGVVLAAWGEPRREANLAPHWEIGERLGLLDLPRGVKISGSGFIAYRAKGARLVRALMSWFLDVHTAEHAYEEVWVPFLVTRQTMTGTGQLPKFEDDMYAVTADALFLIPTAEVPLTNLFRDEILDGAQLPIGLTAYTPCFRREAGAAGKDTRGLLRVHQFDKVELVRFCAPADGPAELERLTRHAEVLLERLGLAYRRKLLAAGDTGFASAKTYDLEVWAPGVGQWLEVSSCSLFTDFQARRANIRFREAPKDKPQFVHTLNGSALAFPRTIAALLETHQRADGSVSIPEPLRPYLGMDRLD